jgi:aarF domain-containing kinase
LHDRGYPHSFQWTDQVLTEAFGDYKQKGLILEEVIGCGSAAQVYRGLLFSKNKNKNDSCQEVAVKVLHPRFQESVDRDLLFIEIMADFLHSLPLEHIKMLNLPRAVEEFSVVLKDQADLTIEAENLRKFRKNFYKDSEKRERQSSIIFPQPIDGWTSSEVIVEDYVHEAAPISDFLFDSSPEGMKVRKELAGPLLRAFLKMVFMDNFIHGDLHPVCAFLIVVFFFVFYIIHSETYILTLSYHTFFSLSLKLGKCISQNSDSSRDIIPVEFIF